MVSNHVLIIKLKSIESAKNRPEFDDLPDTCKSFFVQSKVLLLKVVVHLGQKSSASKELHAHLSSEETLETGKTFHSKLYG